MPAHSNRFERSQAGSGKTPGGTSYHNRFVFVPRRLYLKKDLGGLTEVVLHKEGDRVSVVELRWPVLR